MPGTIRLFTRRIVICLIILSCGSCISHSSEPQTLETALSSTAHVSTLLIGSSETALFTSARRGSAVCVDVRDNYAYFATAYHVISPPEEELHALQLLFGDDLSFRRQTLSVSTSRGRARAFPARVVGQWRDVDLALLEVHANFGTFRPVHISHAAQAAFDQQLIFIGAPFGGPMCVLYGRATFIVRTLKGRDRSIAALQEAAAPAQRGMSGGGVFLPQSMKLAGIIVAATENEDGQIFLGYFVPSATLRIFLAHPKNFS